RRSSDLNNGQPNFLEANLIPSLIKDYGNFPKACKLHLNLSYQQMIMQIIGLGLKRSTKKIPHNKYGADNKATLLPSLT
ncbi:MAG: D-alanine--D-alanine ligase, partial [Patescibacteria group bacterium]|nr:D-alanine--D-alanine ligase [Patescibacteria group bacterium]